MGAHLPPQKGLIGAGQPSLGVCDVDRAYRAGRQLHLLVTPAAIPGVGGDKFFRRLAVAGVEVGVFKLKCQIGLRRVGYLHRRGAQGRDQLLLP